jgi:hypothetical protein
MSLKIENSRRVAESRPVCMDLKRQVDEKLHDFVTVYNDRNRLQTYF